MSYILDALKKSDQLRQRGSTPTLLNAQATATVPRRPRYLLNIALAAALIAAGVALGWLRPWQPESAAPPAGPVASMPVAAAAPRVAAAPPAALPETTAAPQQALPMQQPAAAAAAEPVAAVTAPQPETPVLASSAAPPSSQPVAGATSATDMAKPDRAEPGESVMALNDLPPAIRQGLPAIAIAFHAYSSNPRDRRVMINGEMAEQGELLAGGLSVDEITRDGVILGYKGFRFRQGVR
jgi:general secretion pathway protein B